jgi:hypothetical protein
MIIRGIELIPIDPTGRYVGLSRRVGPSSAYAATLLDVPVDDQGLYAPPRRRKRRCGCGRPILRSSQHGRCWRCRSHAPTVRRCGCGQAFHSASRHARCRRCRKAGRVVRRTHPVPLLRAHDHPELVGGQP